jgi:hypothetical protein
MKRQGESLWNAEANRWNVGKLIVGLFFIGCFYRTVLALAALFDGRAPWKPALYYGAWSIVLVVAFCWLEARRRATRGGG